MDMFEFLSNSKSYRITVISLATLFLILLLVALVPSWRQKVQNLVGNSDRVILAKSHARLNHEGPFLNVIKVKTPEGLFIEVYKENPEAGIEMMGKLPLEGTQDGFFNFQNQATNLVLTDIDEDGNIDIVAPTFDDRQQARMNVFKYNSDTQMFIRMEKE
jgi:hypothetical protein